MNWTHLMCWRQKGKDKRNKLLAEISQSLYLFVRKNSIHERLDWQVLLKRCCNYLSTWGKCQHTESVFMHTSEIVLRKCLVYSHALQYQWHWYKTYFESFRGFPANIGKGPLLLCMWRTTFRRGFPSQKGMTNNLCLFMISSYELILLVHGYTDLLE